ncbi:MAG: cytochrome C [Alphaproteobacteria bacterium]|uniref:Cytochrome C n=1 Tax=Candidatus Nitrobium versatile TaxID=2884831 RepID=A0A953M0P2_9BACT|nr:cytochrome C [Candidatus Nitrobium versatile]
MRRNLFIGTLLLAAALLFLSTVQALRAEEKRIPKNHPVELTSPPLCTECHTTDAGVALKPMASFNHSNEFVKRHRFYAAQTDQLCRSCHALSFCMDCHAYKDELRPSVKYPDKPDRWMPHKGDYIFQHRIDGRIDPAPCFRCHGRMNNRICRTCHK